MSNIDTYAALNKRAFIALLIGGVAIGTSPIFMRLTDVTPTSAAFWRVCLSLPLLLLWVMWQRQKNKAHKQPDSTIKLFTKLRPYMIVGFFFATDLILWHWSVEKTTVANSTLLANIAPVFAALAGFLFFGERFSKTFIAGMALALFGALSLMGQSAEINPANIEGDILGLFTAVAYAGYIVSSARVRQNLSTASVMLGTAVFTSLFLLPVALTEAVSGGLLMPASLMGWLPLIGLAWGTHVVGQSLIIYGLAHLPATFGSISLLIQPVVAAILAWMLFAEALGLFHLIGGILIIAGILLCKKGIKKKKA